MVSRLETIDDLIRWLDSIATMDTRNVKIKKLPEDVISNLVLVQKSLQGIKDRFPTPFKQCHRCKDVYPETEEWFDYSGQGRTGLHAACKFCRNAYQKRHKSKGHKSPYSSADQRELEDHFGPGAIR